MDNVRLEEQGQVMQKIIEQDHCPFCPENLAKYHKLPLLKQGKFWTLTPNQWPYSHCRLHLLAIATQHVETLQDLDPEAGKELIEMFQWVEHEYAVSGGGFAMRFGDTNYSAGTIKHLHAQFIFPDITAPDYEPVRFKIGKSIQAKT
mgnify:CR=1 FL=1